MRRKRGEGEDGAIGTSVADTTSNTGLDFPAAPISAGNSRLMEPEHACVCVSEQNL